MQNLKSEFMFDVRRPAFSNHRISTDSIRSIDRGTNHKLPKYSTMKTATASLAILAASLGAVGAFAPPPSCHGRLQALHSYLDDLEGPAASQYAPPASVGADPTATSRGDKFQYSPCTPIGDNTRVGQYGRLSGLAPGRE